MTIRRIRLVALAIVVAATVAVATYLKMRPVCESSGPSVKGDVRREANGKLLYFDGQCWTMKPMPPRDMPF
jgi:hypothetical protein